MTVDDAYEHNDKVAAPGPAVDGRPGLKWYEIRSPAGSVDDQIRARARSMVATEAEFAGDEVGFVLLHLCRESFYFLLVCRWRNANEMWETVYTSTDGGDFVLLEGGATRATFCVWELGVVQHERLAWIAYLRSTRDTPALTAYLADCFAGPV